MKPDVVRDMLQTFLSASDKYEADEVLSAIQGSELWREQVCMLTHCWHLHFLLRCNSWLSISLCSPQHLSYKVAGWFTCLLVLSLASNTCFSPWVAFTSWSGSLRIVMLWSAIMREHLHATLVCSFMIAKFLLLHSFLSILVVGYICFEENPSFLKCCHFVCVLGIQECWMCGSLAGYSISEIGQWNSCSSNTGLVCVTHICKYDTFPTVSCACDTSDPSET